MKRLLCLALVAALLAPVTAYAQSSPPSVGSGEISRDITGGPASLPQVQPRPMPFVDETDRGLLGIGDPQALLEGLATVTRTSSGNTIVTAATEKMRSLFLEGAASRGPMSSLNPGVLPIGGDDRIQVVASSALPERAVGLLWASFSNGSSGTCAGTLIGSRTVLTAAHCIYDHEADGWASEVAFYPGLVDVEAAPHGTFAWKSADILQPYLDRYEGHYGSVAEWDLAVITLAEPAGDTLGWLAIEPDDGAAFAARFYDYPTDKPDGTLWHEDCGIGGEGERRGSLLLHACMVRGTGGPLLDLDGESLAIRAVNTASDATTSYAVRLDAAYYDWVSARAE